MKVAAEEQMTNKFKRTCCALQVRQKSMKTVIVMKSHLICECNKMV